MRYMLACARVCVRVCVFEFVCICVYDVYALVCMYVYSCAYVCVCSFDVWVLLCVGSYWVSVVQSIKCLMMESI